jgi:hypothetical protein
MNNYRKAEPRMPKWFRCLGGANPVFGARKDKLVLEIFYMGGMDSLEKEYGFRFGPKDRPPECKPSLNSLIQIRRNLIRESEAAMAHLLLAHRLKLKISKTKRTATSGMVSGKIHFSE